MGWFSKMAEKVEKPEKPKTTAENPPVDPKYNDDDHLPFGSILKTPWYRYIQILIFSVSIAPIRFILIIILCCFNCVLYGILRAFSTDEEMEKIFQKSWQKNILKLIAASY